VSTSRLDGSGILRWPMTWPLWKVPPRLVMSLLIVEFTVVGITITLAVRHPSPDAALWLRAGLLLICCIVYDEVVSTLERTRRRLVDGTMHIDLGSTWTFAGALVLPPSLAVGLAVLLTAYKWMRTGRPRVPLYRTVYTSAVIALSCLVAGAVVDGPAGSDLLDGTGIFAVLIAIGTYTTVNGALIAGAVAVSSSKATLAMLVGDRDDNLLEFATLSLGAFAAVALILNPWLVPLVLLPMGVMQRAMLVRRLQEAASIDAKTGLLNAATWHARAEAALRRPLRGAPPAVLVIDLDHFKEVNDTHGHLAGDQVLVAVADAVRAEVRDRDLVGRFGGEEFVVLLDSGCDEAVESVAERIRRRVAGLRVELPTADGPLTVASPSISIGCAVQGVGEPPDLTALVRVADMAVFAAKRAGRNRVRTGQTLLADPTMAVQQLVTASDEIVAQDHHDVGPLFP
jgi:diguanylate cyclase (GGDEF)-like protein